MKVGKEFNFMELSEKSLPKDVASFKRKNGWSRKEKGSCEGRR